MKKIDSLFDIRVMRNEDYCSTVFNLKGKHKIYVELMVDAYIKNKEISFENSQGCLITYTFNKYGEYKGYEIHGDCGFFAFLEENGLGEFSDVDLQHFAHWIMANHFHLIEEELEKYKNKNVQMGETLFFSCVYRGETIKIELINHSTLVVNGKEVDWENSGEYHHSGETPLDAYKRTMQKLSDSKACPC
jgi:hypothetical protein